MIPSSLTTGVSLLLRVVGFGASLVLLYTTSDRRFGFLSLLLALMALRQLLTVLGVSLPLAELPGFAVSVLAVALVYYLLQYGRQEAEVAEELAANNEQLRAHRNRLQATFEASPDYTFVFDETSRYVDILSGSEDITIREPGAFIDQSVFEVLPEETAVEVDEAIQETLETGETQRVEYRLPFDDRVEWYEGRTARVDFPDADRRHVLFIARDVTARKRREQELRRFRKAVESAGHAISIVDRDGTIAYVNPAFEEITGYEESEAIGRRPAMLSSGEHGEAFYEDLWDTILSGDVWHHEIVNRRKSGERYVASQTVAPVVDESGDVTEFVAIQTDVTERKRREEQLQQAREEYAELFDGISDPVFVHEPDGSFVAVNEAATDLFGYDEEELLSLTPEDISTRRAETVRERERELLDSEDVRFESTFLAADGAEVPVEVNATTVNYRGERRALSVVRDVSERKERERQLAVLDRILRHNLHNDMTVILGYATEIQTRGDDELAEYAATIRQVAEALLDTADKERQVVELLSDPQSRHPLDVATVARRQVELLGEAYPDAEIRATLPDTATVVAIDQIERAVSELVENAVVHSDRDAPRVEVSVDVHEEAVELCVSDDGPGIPEQERSVLAGEHDIGPLYHGSGMGLWLVDRIVHLSGGDLRFGETAPRGSRVTVELSRVEGPPA
ncbi:MAG: PAS domain S-box protein [Haloferacaceae archaeon]